MSDNIDYTMLIIQVKNYIQDKTTRETTVVLNVDYLGEEKEFSAKIPFTENKKQDFYVNRALKNLKKEIKQFVKDTVKTPSIIGTFLSIPGDFAVDD